MWSGRRWVPPTISACPIRCSRRPTSRSSSPRPATTCGVVARALDAALLDRPEYKTVRDRQTHRAEVVAAISSVTRLLSSDEVVARLGAAKANVAKFHSIAEAADHEQLRAVGGVESFEYGGESVDAVASPFRMHGLPTSVRRPPPSLDEHREKILAEFGYGREGIGWVAADGAFGSPFPPRKTGTAE